MMLQTIFEKLNRFDSRNEVLLMLDIYQYLFPLSMFEYDFNIFLENYLNSLLFSKIFFIESQYSKKFLRFICAQKLFTY